MDVVQPVTAGETDGGKETGVGPIAKGVWMDTKTTDRVLAGEQRDIISHSLVMSR